jgi:hypothetical protein
VEHIEIVNARASHFAVLILDGFNPPEPDDVLSNHISTEEALRFVLLNIGFTASAGGKHLEPTIFLNATKPSSAADQTSVCYTPGSLSVLMEDFVFILLYILQGQGDLLVRHRVELNPVTEDKFKLLRHDSRDNLLTHGKGNVVFNSLTNDFLNFLVISGDGDIKLLAIQLERIS